MMHHIMGSGQSQMAQSPVGLGAAQLQQSSGAQWSGPQPSIVASPHGGFGIGAEQPMDIVTRFLNREEQGLVLPQVTPLNQEPMTFLWEMDVLYLHRELPAHRSCQQESLDTKLCMSKRKCITCNAYLNSK